MIDEAHVRREKLQALKAAGMDPYPAAATHRSADIGQALIRFDEWSASQQETTLAGRVMTIRVHGAILFVDLMDESGRLQIVYKQEILGESSFALFRDAIDPGDIIEVSGVLFTTKRGEKSLEAKNWHVLTKALLPLPEKWHGLQDIEQRFRHRELDILSNPEVKERFLVRSRVVSSLRRFLDERGFLEVETPMLQSIPGGANARPFLTHHNALDIDLYLRIAPELYLKRLMVAGFEKVYEIGKSFRNEGIDYAHNPEFTTIELYWAYVEKETYIKFLEQILETIIQAGVGSLALPYEDGTLNFTAPYPRVTFRQSIIDACGIDIDQYREPALLIEAVRNAGLSIDFGSCVGIGEHYDELYKKTARPKMRQPVWVLDYPCELKPLARRHPTDPTKSASVQLVVQGAEIINAYYHELNDPLDQRARFEDQQDLREQGSEEAQWLDQEFLNALEHGMPPASGMAIGIDRLVAFITNAPHLKEVILFPTLRPIPTEETSSAS